MDALVNAAGIGAAPADFDTEFDTDNFERIMKINLASVFYMTKYACPEFEKIGGGSIVNISSGAALHSGGAVAYTASKGGVKSMTRMLGNYLGKKHIRVNSVYPGLVRSEMIDGVIKQNKAAFDMVAERTPLGRIGEPEDIAYCVLYLASDASSWVTGQDFVIDGGDSC